MKVYFVSAGYDSCYYVRCMLPLQAGGWWGDIATLRGVKNTPEQAMRGVMDADVVVFQRPMDAHMVEMIKILHANGKALVFDNDDTYRPDSGVPRVMRHIEGVEEQVDELLEAVDNNLKISASLCDIITVTSPFLAEEYKDVGEVIILPNMVNPDDWLPPIENDTGKVRVGISGSVASSRDWESAQGVITELSQMDNVKLVLFGLPPDDPKFKEQRHMYKEDIDFWESIGAEWHAWVGIEDYKRKLRSLKLDMAIIPRFDNYFNRCKSNLKYLEHAMLKIPVVAQGFTDGLSPYQADIINGVNGFISITPESWAENVVKLIDSENLRKEIGENAYNYVKEKYNINKNINMWETTYLYAYSKSKKRSIKRGL